LINSALDYLLPWVFLLILLLYPVIYLARGVLTAQKEKKLETKKNKLSEIFLGTLILFAGSCGIFGIFWGLPKLIFLWVKKPWLIESIRWILFAITIFTTAYLLGHKYGARRWEYSSIGHILVFFAGWAVNRWIGIIFISMPLVAVYYCSLYVLAQNIMPTAAPENKQEKWEKFLILVSYTWGIQRPLYATGENAWSEIETRIPGRDLVSIHIPGLIWTRPHEVVGITSGMKFKGVDGPGLVFTKKQERPMQIMDLRSQVRSAEIDVVSKDGVGFRVLIFAEFRLDPEEWDQKTYNDLRPKNPILRGADKINHREGSFPFSSLRLQAAISTTGSNANHDATLYWDKWSLSVIESETRQIISQLNLDELWRPREDKKGINALDEIANKLMERSKIKLRTNGILLLAARVVNFRFPKVNGKTDRVSEQQISTWEAEWARKNSEILDKARAESERNQLEARAYAESVLLSSIAEGLKKTEDKNSSLPNFVISMRFLSALQDLIHQTNEDEIETEIGSKLGEFESTLLTWKGLLSDTPGGKQS
jgi:hypothetical protein